MIVPRPHARWYRRKDVFVVLGLLLLLGLVVLLKLFSIAAMNQG